MFIQYVLHGCVPIDRVVLEKAFSRFTGALRALQGFDLEEKNVTNNVFHHWHKLNINYKIL
jgi:hypothetical protein